MNILAIGAHPDDLDVCCGGTLTRFSQAGDRVTMCVVTDGRAHPVGDPDRVTALRRAEAQASADLIGANLRWLGIPDGRVIDDIPTRLKFIQLMMDVSPDLIITSTPAAWSLPLFKWPGRRRPSCMGSRFRSGCRSRL
jgi:N-acetylglucosamine malate deacetylase 1